MPRRTVLLTGAAGFIGSHTAELLLENGDRVLGLDNFNDYYAVDVKRDNARQLSRHAQFEMVEGDVRDGDLVQDLFSRHNFDAVIHLAAMAGVRASVDDPLLYFAVNVEGTIRLLEAASHAELPPNFVFASTSSAYGNTREIPFVETDRADTPLAPYPASKRSAEMLGHSYHHIYGLDFTALRFFTVYGPRNRPDMLAHLALDGCYGKKKLVLNEDGEMWRDWTYVKDIADGVVRASERRLGYEVINLGRGQAVQLRQFVETVSAEVGLPVTWSSQPMPAADVPRTFANIEKARKLLGYDPQVQIEDGVRQLVRWYRSYHGS